MPDASRAEWVQYDLCAVATEDTVTSTVNGFGWRQAPTFALFHWISRSTPRVDVYAMASLTCVASHLTPTENSGLHSCALSLQHLTIVYKCPSRMLMCCSCVQTCTGSSVVALDPHPCRAAVDSQRKEVELKVGATICLVVLRRWPGLL